MNISFQPKASLVHYILCIRDSAKNVFILHCVTLAHRALADVEAMEKLFTSLPLVECLSSLKSHCKLPTAHNYMPSNCTASW